MAQTPVILVADDDAHIREVVRFALKKEGFDSLEAADGQQALEVFAQAGPDLVVLDILMPEMDGTEVCRRIRALSDTPIIFLSSRDEEIDRILGLELGGDDYVTKPFSPRELIARIRARLRRRTSGDPPPSPTAKQDHERILEHGLLCLNPETLQVFWDRTPVELTRREFEILRTLLARPSKVFTRDELMDGAYGRDHFVSDRTIDSHIRSVRKKMAAAGGDPIRTAHGVGYSLGPCLGQEGRDA